jgi:hypothetical protein
MTPSLMRNVVDREWSQSTRADVSRSSCMSPPYLCPVTAVTTFMMALKESMS